jgi:hypothetical protein
LKLWEYQDQARTDAVFGKDGELEDWDGSGGGLSGGESTFELSWWCNSCDYELASGKETKLKQPEAVAALRLLNEPS